MQQAMQQATESCAHAHVRDSMLRLCTDRPRVLLQLGYCLDCGFHVYRVSETITLGAWTIDGEGTARAKVAACRTVVVPGAQRTPTRDVA